MTPHLPQFSRSQGPASPSLGKAVTALAIKGTSNDAIRRYATSARHLRPTFHIPRCLSRFATVSATSAVELDASFNAHRSAQFPGALLAAEVQAA